MGDQVKKGKKKYRKLKRVLIVVLVLLAAFAIYVEIVNRNSKHMTYRQKVLKAVYPAWMWMTRLAGKNRTRLSGNGQAPPVSFYSLKAVYNNGDTLDFSTLKGKKVLLVNTASDCGYTSQYNDLQALADQYSGSLVVIGFPANDFKEQEKGTDEEIAEFCKSNFGLRFPLMKKSVVISAPAQNAVYAWLTDPAKNGWNNKPPTWNFSKYLVNEAGVLTHYFDPSVSPLSADVVNAIGQP